jgi:hypothetical protein
MATKSVKPTKRAISARAASGPPPGLSAVALKETLWETLNRIKSDQMLPSQGDAIASQAREILRTIKVQLQIVGQAKRTVPIDVVEFAERSRT